MSSLVTGFIYSAMPHAFMSDKLWQSMEHMAATGLYIDGLVQDCSNSIANALELLQSCTEPLIFPHVHVLTQLAV